MFKTMKPFAAPLPEGAQPAPLWGDEQHVRELLGDRVDDVVAEARRPSRSMPLATPEAFRDYFKAHYGPTIAVYNRIADDPDQVRALDEALVALAAEHGLGVTGEPMQWEYLLLTARKR